MHLAKPKHKFVSVRALKVKNLNKTNCVEIPATIFGLLCR